MKKSYHKVKSPNRPLITSRIVAVLNSLGWRTTVSCILEQEKSFNKLKVAEVGCDLGIFSLTLSLLGADSTLIDLDQGALNSAERIFKIYNQEAQYVQADVLGNVPDYLKGKFDFVMSGGLAEHFMGEDLFRCFSFHKALLKPGGFAFIATPNTFSFCYQVVRWFRILTGTWKENLVKPSGDVIPKCAGERTFSYWELKRIANQVGFKRNCVVGNQFLKKDIYGYLRGLLYSILLLFPRITRRKLRTILSKKEKWGFKNLNNKFLEEKILIQSIKGIKENKPTITTKQLKDYFSSGLILFGWV